MNKSVELENTAAIRGMVLKVAHMVEAEEVKQ
jgi:ribosomal protein L30/L7E